jgi:hypothetical protein
MLNKQQLFSLPMSTGDLESIEWNPLKNSSEDSLLVSWDISGDVNKDKNSESL